MRDDIETRTIAMNDAIKFLEEGEAGIFCEFHPGNGTRYVVGLTPLGVASPTKEEWPSEGDYHRTRGAVGELVSGGWLVTWINGNRRCVLQPDGFLSPAFLKKKLGGSIADAVVLSRLIGHLTRREVDSWEPYNERD